MVNHILEQNPSRLNIIVAMVVLALLLGCSTPSTPAQVQATPVVPSPTTTTVPPTPNNTLVPPTATPVPPTPTITPIPIPPLAKPWGARQQISVDGKWEYVKVKSLDDPLPSSGWQSFNVPGTLRGYNYERAWFRRKFIGVEQWRRQRLILQFGGVKYNSRILVNGKNVGGLFNGYDAFEIDITDAAKLGAENELLVGVNDWTGIFTGAPMSFPTGMDMNVMRGAVKDHLLAPIGGQYWLYGIWDSVTLRVVPQTYVQSISVRPSVQQNRLDVIVVMKNASASAFTGSLQARLFNWAETGRDDTQQWELRGNPIANLTPTQVSIAPGQWFTTTLSLDTTRSPLELWTPYNPRLYVLEVGFENGDSIRERIGYREVTTRGGDFYLNGIKIHLLSTSYWPPSQTVTRDYITGELRAIRAMNAVGFRTHTQPWTEMWYEVADEVGLMMIPEGAIWNDDGAYRVDDQQFWNNYATHLKTMVQHLGNHPSIVMWSLENEFYGTRATVGSVSETQLTKLGLMVKQTDPTRPITYESDGDPGGVTDVIGIHYPNEYPDHRLWPQDAYWMNTPRVNFGGGGMFWNNQPFLWDHKKPLYIGEYLWDPSRDPSTETLFFGDEAYRSHQMYRTAGKAEAWRMQMLAYRYYGVSGQSPWTVHEEGAMDETNPAWVAQRDVYRPLAAFALEQDTRLYASDSITRTVELFNDTMGDLPQVEFRWMLLDGDKALNSGSENLAMPSGDHQERILKIDIPQVSALKSMTLRLTMNVGSEEKFREAYGFQVYPRLERWQTLTTPIVLYDPKSTLEKKWSQVTYRSIKQLLDWDGQGLLIIAPEALTNPNLVSDVTVIGDPNSQAQWLAQQVQKGGRILVLEQSETASVVLPVTLSNQSSTISFPQIASHPIVQGINEKDLRWWRGDHLVSQHEPARVAGAGIYPIIVTGSARGVANAPLVEIQQGNGVWIICQMEVVTKLDTEPTARILFERMLKYLSDFRPVTGNGAVISSPALQDQLRSLGVDVQPLTDWKSLAFPRVQLLVLQTNAASVTKNIDTLREFVNAGGQVVWHRPDPKDFASVRDALKLPITIQPYRGFAQRAEGDSMLTQTLFREDLYWLGKLGSTDWQKTELATDMTDCFFVPDSKTLSGNVVEATRNVKFDGSIVRIEKNEVAFYTNGTAQWNVQVTQSGLYEFTLVARGTPLQNGYPIVQVLLDNTPVGMLYVAKRELGNYSVRFHAEPRSHQIKIVYGNDQSSPTEDRNLFVDQYALNPVHGVDDVELLTTPSALVSVPMGKGRFVVNAIRWDEAGTNQGRAQRFITSLLTALGARFPGRGQLSVLEAETMTPQPDYKYFRREADYITMPTNGYVEKQIRVATAGRYRIGIVAKGTPADGTYPIAALEVNGREIGRVECKSDDWSAHFITADLPAGTLTLRLRFTNDLWLPEKGEDRNLYVDRLEFEWLR